VAIAASETVLDWLLPLVAPYYFDGPEAKALNLMTVP
jgi:hypothetical protein